MKSHPHTNGPASRPIPPIAKYAATALAIVATLYFVIAISLGGWGQKPLPLFLDKLPKPFLFAHRGVTTMAAENSLGSIAAAKERGFAGLETDLQISRDGHFFLFHDLTGERLLASPDTLSAKTFAELETILLPSADTTMQEYIPGLDQVISQWGNEFIFFFDMKGYGHPGIRALARDISDFVATHRLGDRAIIASASLRFLLYLKWLNSSLTTVYEGPKNGIPPLVDLIPSDLRPDLYCNYSRHLSAESVREIADRGLWGNYIAHHVDSTNIAETLLWGAPFITVDDCSALDAILLKR